jgi:hypothetical protein
MFPCYLAIVGVDSATAQTYVLKSDPLTKHTEICLGRGIVCVIVCVLVCVCACVCARARVCVCAP